MLDRRPAPFLICVCLLLAAAQLFAFVPQLHACAMGAGASGISASGGPTAPAGVRGPSRGKTATEDCPACRIANMALVVPEGLPAAATLIAAGSADQPLPQACRTQRLDRACGRAPPHP